MSENIDKNILKELDKEVLEKVTGGAATPVHSDIGTTSDENALPYEFPSGRK